MYNGMKNMELLGMISKHFIIWALIVSLFVIGYIFHAYTMSIAVGAILAVATRPVYESLTLKLNSPHSRVYVSTFLTLSLFLFVFLPLIYFVGLSYQFIPNISTDQTMFYIQKTVAQLKALPEPFDIFQESVNALLGKLNINSVDMNIIKSILNNFGQFLLKVNAIVYQFFLILFFYFLFNLYGSKIFVLVTRLLPMAKKFKRELYNELSSTISSVFFGTLFSMLLQGFTFGLFLYIFTDYDAFYFGMATGFMTAIPIVGTYLIAVPLAVMELLNQNYIFAGVIVLFALVVLSGVIDNFLRLIFMRYISKKFSLNYSLSELFILLAMIAGVGVFGGWGIIIAPAILSLSIAIINIYLKSRISNRLLKNLVSKQ